MDEVFDLTVIGTVLGAFYAMVALGWVLVFRATRVLNFTTASFFLLGGYVYYSLTAKAGFAPGVALIGSAVATAALAATSYRVAVHPLAGSPTFAAILSTLGLAAIFQAAMLIIWGPNTIPVAAPVSVSAIDLPASARIEGIGLFAIGCSVALTAVLTVGMKSRYGLEMRAAAENPTLASQSGVNLAATGALAWALAGAVLAIGGVAYAATTALTPASASIALRGLIPAFLGGLDSVPGALVGGLIVGILETYLVHVAGAQASDAAVSVILLVCLIFRPVGLFGSREVLRA